MRAAHWARAIRIVLALARPRPLPMREIDVEVPAAPGRALVYDPPRGTPKGAVVIVPGLAVQAHDDPRLHNLAMGFARGGLRGIVLEVPDMGGLLIRPETEHDLARRIVALADAGHVPHGRLGLLGPSFSGSLALRAAATPEARDLVRSVITVGAYADAGRTVSYLFHAAEADSYGRLVLLLNFLPLLEPISEAQLTALRVAIMDTHVEPDEAQLDAALDALGTKAGDRLRAVLRDPGAWGRVGEAMLTEAGDRLDALSVEPIAAELRCAVFVMHGASDSIVPPSESVELDAVLRAAGVASHVVVTPLLGHADIEGGLTAVRDAARMVGGFAHFVRGLWQAG